MSPVTVRFTGSPMLGQCKGFPVPTPTTLPTQSCHPVARLAFPFRGLGWAQSNTMPLWDEEVLALQKLAV